MFLRGVIMTVRRYESLAETKTGNPLETMEEHNWGTFVLAEDFDDLLIDLKDLQAKYDRLVEKLGDLWREG